MIEFCAQKEGEATEIGDYKTNNKYARYEEKCLRYLFEHNQLRALHHYLGHDNHRVRLSAAYALLPLFEEERVFCREHGINYIQKIYPGTHEWRVWRAAAHDFFQMLFK